MCSRELVDLARDDLDGEALLVDQAGIGPGGLDPRRFVEHLPNRVAQSPVPPTVSPRTRTVGSPTPTGIV